MSNKHAYLIIAHANSYVLEKLILLVDDERNDIFIHVDKKTKDFDFAYYQSLVQKSKLYFTDRIDVRWGHMSQIEAELILFKTACFTNEYQYYHLISGADLPVRSQDDIHSFCQKYSGKEFIGFSNADFDYRKVSKIHLFSRNMRVGEQEYLLRIKRKIRLIFLSIQGILGYNRCSSFEGSIKFGANWASLTHHFVQDLVKQEIFFLQFYKHSSCADEIYKHTFAYNSKYRDSVYCLDDELKGCQRFIDWHRGRPYTFRKDDFEDLMNKPFLFARKFDDAVDKEIVDLIYDKLKA